MWRKRLLMKREFSTEEPELMDLPQPVTPELEKDLRNLAAMNQRFGSHWMMRRFLSAWFAPGRRYRVLDLATGAGDIPRMMVEWAATRGVTFEIDAVDANPSTIEIARKLHPAPQINWIAANALTYESADTYDFVCCSLSLHHFSEDDAVRLLRRCQRLSHRFTLVADLERSWWTAVGVWLLTTLWYTDHGTRHDGLVSVRRAFSFQELSDLAVRAGWTEFEHSRFAFCRQAIWTVAHDVGDIPVPVLEQAAPLPCPT